MKRLPTLCKHTAVGKVAAHTVRLMSCLLVWAVLASVSSSANASGPSQSFELQIDNDQLAFTPGSQERWYTSGLFMRGASVPDPDGADARLLSFWCDRVIACDPAASRLRVWSLAQAIYTPAYTGTELPQPKDWPYAAGLNLGLSVLAQGDRTRQLLGLRLGVLGPPALGEQTQNAVHRLMGQPLARGFDLQVKTQPLVELDWSRLVAMPLSASGLDVVTRTALTLGNPVTQASAGAVLRWGHLPRGPGWPGELMPVTHATRRWYVFGGIDARAVARNQFIDGTTNGYESQVKSRHGVGAVLVGGSVAVAPGWWLDLGVEWRTLEFSAPEGARSMTPQRVGSLQLRWAPD